MKAKLVKIVQFELVSFFDQSQKPEPRQVVIIYGLGSDGVVREFSGGKWQAFPVYDSVIDLFSVPDPGRQQRYEKEQ